MKFFQAIKIFGISLLALGCYESAHAQQDPQYTHYMYNTSMINPAYAGSRGSLTAIGLYRTQWVGLEGAPKTASFSLNTPLGDSGLGLGVNFNNDKLGAMNENNIAIDLSYAINLSYEYKLAFGVKGTANLLDVDYSKLTIRHPGDEVAVNNINNKFNPNIGAGVYLYSDRTYLGLSVPMFLETDRYDDNDMVTMVQRPHFYLMGGHVFDLSHNLKFKPAFLAKAVTGAPLQVDLTANFLLMEKLTLGAAYRWDAAVSALAGFQINENLFIGYSYDAETTKLRHYNSGSHEFILRFELFNNKGRINTPRFF